MKKIVISLVAIVFTIGLVATAAYALFSDTVSVSGLTVHTGQPDLKITTTMTGPWNRPSNPINFADTASFDGLFEDNLLYPGFGQAEDKCATFALLNDSSVPISFDFTAQLPDGGVTEEVVDSWNSLKDVVEIGLDNVYNPTGMVWNTLANWNYSSHAFDGVANTISPTNTKFIKMCIKVPETAGNTISGKHLSNVTFNITGTQVATSIQ